MENNRHCRALVFRKTVVARALAVAFGAVSLVGGISTTAFAQSNTTGNIFGRVDSAAGVTIVIENTGTGLKRTLTPDATGRFVATALPPGTYKASLLRNGAVEKTQDGIEVLLGQGAEVALGGAKALQDVQVVGQRTRIDVSNTNNGATFTAKELESIPSVRSVDNIIQLAPNTTRADSRYAGGASFGGGGPSENSYYINGFPVTNALTQLGGSQLPFGAIGQAQILTGGFGAEFGRSVGGVVNVTTKSGTNAWEAGMQVSVKPAALRSKSVDSYFPVTGDPANANTDGTLRLRRSENKVSETAVGAFLSGPIVPDKLFMFMALEQINTNTDWVAGLRTSRTNASNGWGEDRLKTQRYLGKFDWNLTNDHRLEWTTIADRPTLDQSFSGYDYATGAKNGVVTSGGYFKNFDNLTAQGADVNILKYTGELTPDLTLTALYGRSKSQHINDYNGYDPTIPGVTFGAGGRAPGISYPQLNPIPGQFVLASGSEDQVKGYRLDLEYRMNKHTIRGGLDDNKLSSNNAGQVVSGGKLYSYYKASAANTINPNFKPYNASRGINLQNPAYGPLATQGYYGREYIFSSVTSAYSDQTAQYIEDKYQATKDLLLTVGLRRETYENLNGDKQVFLKNDQLNPRFAAAWDVNGNSSLKVFGSAGRYSLQIPTHIAVRGASRSTYTRSYFTYTGIDATGAPTGRIDVTDPKSSNNEYGQAKDYQTVSSTDLKATYQDEITLGFEKALNPRYNGGVKMTYRNLKSTVDDFCDPRPFDTWLARNPSVDASNWGGFGCASINPGIAQTFKVDFNDRNPDPTKRGQHTTVALSAADIGLPEAERKYFALDFFLEHPLHSGWYGKVNYTYSTSKGNTEGQTLSDIAQTDVAATQVWDHPELMEGAFGYLANDRRHQIKAYGFVQLNPEWQIGGNILLASGRPKNCIGYYAGTSPTQAAVDYGSSYFYCNGVATPRGSQGYLPWDKRLDLNVIYKTPFLKGLELRADVTNVFNAQTPQTIDEVYNNNVDDSISSTYNRVISTTAPRSVRLAATYNYKF